MITTVEQINKLLQIGHPSPVPSREIQPKDINGNFIFLEVEKNDFQLLASEALQWIRENKGIECGVYPTMKETKGDIPIKIFYEYIFIDYNRDSETGINNLFSNIGIYPTYLLAESALLTAVLDYLINNVLRKS